MIQHFLRQQWALPLATPKIVQGLRINLDAKATETEHLWLPQMYISHEKEGCPFQPPKSSISLNLDYYGPEIMHIQLTKYKIFLCTPCNPRQGLALWTTTLGLLPSLIVASAPHVENFPKPIAKQLECIDQPK